MNSIALVAAPEDQLARVVETQLRGRGCATRWMVPGTLAGQRVTIGQHGITAGGEPLRGVLWRVPADAAFSVDFVEADQYFTDLETRAVWLAILNSAFVSTNYRPDAAAFFTGSSSLLWRHRFARAGVRLSPLLYGNVGAEGDWVPYHYALVRSGLRIGAAKMLGIASLQVKPGRLVLLADTLLIDVTTGETCGARNAMAAAAVLRERGLCLATLQLDAEDAVIGIDPIPRCHDDLAARVASTVARLVDDGPDRR